MKILNVIVNLDEQTGGGATERVYQVSRHLARAGHDVTVLTTDYRLTAGRLASLEGVQVVAVRCLLPRYFVPLPSLGRIDRAVMEADVVHFVSHWSLLSALTYPLVRIRRKPYIVSPLGALPVFGRSGAFKRIYNFVVGTNMVRNATRFVVATLAEMPAFRSYGAQETRVAHIPNGINEEDYSCVGDDAFAQRIGVGANPFVLFMGRLNPIKGPDLLLEAFCSIEQRVPECHVVVIGHDEGMMDALKNIATSCGVADRVHFLGFVSREDKSRVIHLSRLVVVPSRKDAMSIVVLEAGIAGKPVLITDQCGFEEVRSIGGGRVVPATVEGIAAGLVELLGHPEQLAVMGECLRKFTVENYLWSSMATRYAVLFQGLSH